MTGTSVSQAQRYAAVVCLVLVGYMYMVYYCELFPFARFCCLINSLACTSLVPRPSLAPVFAAYCKRSKGGAREGLEMNCFLMCRWVR